MHIQLIDLYACFAILVCKVKFLPFRLQNQLLRVNQSQRRMLMVIIQELANAFELHDGHLELIDAAKESAEALHGAGEFRADAMTMQ